MLSTKGESFKNKVVSIPGTGNVAQYACEKATELGAQVVTLSDSNGFVYDPKGITAEKLAWIMDLKNVRAAGSANTPTSSIANTTKASARGESKPILPCRAPRRMK